MCGQRLHSGHTLVSAVPRPTGTGHCRRASGGCRSVAVALRASSCALARPVRSGCTAVGGSSVLLSSHASTLPKPIGTSPEARERIVRQKELIADLELAAV